MRDSFMTALAIPPFPFKEELMNVIRKALLPWNYRDTLARLESAAVPAG